MSAPLCVVVGAGRLATGYVAPLLADAGWQVALTSRTAGVLAALRGPGGLVVHSGRDLPRPVDGVVGVHCDNPSLPALVRRADLVVTSVGPGALPEIGARLGPMLLARLAARRAPLNVLTFENHRRAPELLAGGLMATAPELAAEIGRRLGLAGAAAWQVAASRDTVGGTLVVHTDGVTESYVDAVALRPGVPPLDGSLPGPVPVAPFDEWITAKLWAFNGGHAAAAYLGRLAGHETVAAALTDPALRAQVRAVVVEALAALPPSQYRDPETLLDRYAEPLLADPVTRVAREPRRKLGPGDRLIGPAVAGLAAGVRPVALARVAAAALAYQDPDDPQSVTLSCEVALLGPAEVLAAVSVLDPGDELSRLICAAHDELAAVAQ
jgi:mannitol-1-phosphate 5-dehydrogenase